MVCVCLQMYKKSISIQNGSQDDFTPFHQEIESRMKVEVTGSEQILGLVR